MLRFIRDNRERFPYGFQVTGTSSTTTYHAALEKEFEFLRCVEANVLGDLTKIPESDLVFHFASPASAQLINSQPEEMFRLLTLGAENLKQMLKSWKGCPRILLASSGAVYNWSGDRSVAASEGDVSAPETLNPSSCYGEGKRVAELILSMGSVSNSYQLLVARMFAFGGPGLPLDQHFAIGNFVRDALTGGPITVLGNPNTVRSYLSADEMAEWLFSIAISGRPGTVYHVGSEKPISIVELATLVAEVAEDILDRKIKVVVDQNSSKSPSSFYVPSTERTRSELSVRESMSVKEIVISMIQSAIQSDSMSARD